MSIFFEVAYTQLQNRCFTPPPPLKSTLSMRPSTSSASPPMLSAQPQRTLLTRSLSNNNTQSTPVEKPLFYTPPATHRQSLNRGKEKLRIGETERGERPGTTFVSRGRDEHNNRLPLLSPHFPDEIPSTHLPPQSSPRTYDDPPFRPRTDDFE